MLAKLEVTREGLRSNGRLLALPTNIGLGRKWMEVTNTSLLRYGSNYYSKKIIVQVPAGPMLWNFLLQYFTNGRNKLDFVPW
jgi:hypothetical protein